MQSRGNKGARHKTRMPDMQVRFIMLLCLVILLSCLTSAALAKNTASATLTVQARVVNLSDSGLSREEWQDSKVFGTQWWMHQCCLQKYSKYELFSPRCFEKDIYPRINEELCGHWLTVAGAE